MLLSSPGRPARGSSLIESGPTVIGPTVGSPTPSAVSLEMVHFWMLALVLVNTAPTTVAAARLGGPCGLG